LQKLGVGVLPANIPVAVPVSTDVPVADVSGMGVGQLIPIMKEMGEDIKEIKGSDDERKQRDLLEKESNGPDPNKWNHPRNVRRLKDKQL
ncbi:unnamed protein product, partial [marine sediment metagenome]